MLISKFSRDGKSGFAVGSNSLTPEKISAGLITAASGLLIAGIGGLFKKPQKSSRAGASKKKKKPALWAFALPLVYRGAKSAVQKKSLDAVVSKAVEDNAAQDGGIEVVAAIPISSEREVYDNI